MTSFSFIQKCAHMTSQHTVKYYFKQNTKNLLTFFHVSTHSHIASGDFMELLQNQTIPYGFSYTQTNTPGYSFIFPREGTEREVYAFLYRLCQGLNKRKDRICWREFFRAIFPDKIFSDFESSSEISTPGTTLSSEESETRLNIREFFWFISRLEGMEIVYAISRICPNRARKSKSIRVVTKGVESLGSASTTEAGEREADDTTGIHSGEGLQSDGAGITSNATTVTSNNDVDNESTAQSSRGDKILEGRSGLRLQIYPEVRRATILSAGDNPQVEDLEEKGTKIGGAGGAKKRRRERKAPVNVNTTSDAGNGVDDIVINEDTIEVLDAKPSTLLQFKQMPLEYNVERFIGWVDNAEQEMKMASEMKGKVKRETLLEAKKKAKEASLFYRVHLEPLTDRDFENVKDYISVREAHFKLKNIMEKLSSVK